MGHCVGSYCDDVAGGKSRIYSLRDAKGEPHVTIEVKPNQYLNFNSWWEQQPKELRDEINARARRGEHNSSIFEAPEFLEARDSQPPVIKQIKGKQNRAPKEEYLPFVQDFVKSGQWSDVGDIQNTGLHKLDKDFLGEATKRIPRGETSGRFLPHEREEMLQKAIESKLLPERGYITEQEYEDAFKAVAPPPTPGPTMELLREMAGMPPEGMAGGGKIVKGAAQIGKRLMTDRSLPAAEREANLQKFLAESKAPMRLYHGTTATEDIQGKEAIRKLKPSKEGALGSGVYLTPKAEFASEYANPYIPGSTNFASGNVLPVHAQIKNPLVIEGKGDPMIEALTKLGMDEDKAARMVERAYEEKGYIGKQVENRARAAGYDGLMQYRDGELSEVVSYNPNAVKSAIGNEGTYDIYNPELSKADGGSVFKKIQFMADGGGAFKTLQWKEPQNFDGGGLAIDLSEPSEGASREPILTKKDLETIRRNAPDVYEWAKQSAKDEANQLRSARGMKDFALRTGASYLGGPVDLINLGLMIPDALVGTSLSSEKPFLGSEQIIDAMSRVGMVGENEFPIAETAAGFLSPASLVKKGRQLYKNSKASKDAPKKRRGGLAAMSR
jgi:hypothetical protein